MITRRNFIAGAGAVAGLVGLSACNAQSAADSGSGGGTTAAVTPEQGEAVLAGVDPTRVPTSHARVAMLHGTWEEMGHQLGQQFPEDMLCAANASYQVAIEQVGTYDALVEAYTPYKELYDQIFVNESDGKYTDMFQGLADELGIDFWQLAPLVFPNSPEGEIASSGDDSDTSSDEKDCSAIAAWGEALADGATGCISIMDADTDAADLDWEPVAVIKPNSGHTYISMSTFFGSVTNACGLAIQSPGGSSVLAPQYGTWPHPWIAAYCSTTQEAIDFMGDPDGDESTWVPIVSDYNMVTCDATGDACDYEINSKTRHVRRCHDPKPLSPTEGDEMSDEASTYILTNNLYLSDNMLDDVLSNVRQDLPVYWDDVEPRYWTVDKVLSDAVAAGGITLDTLVEAESEKRYYVPEGWNYDYYPDWLYGRWVPSSIYDQLDEEGGITRAEYYGENYDPSVWGEPMSKEDSRQTEVWQAGWHETCWSATPEVSTIGYWSPTPVSEVDKNSSRDVFDSNTLTQYYQVGSSDRLLSLQPESTGTFAIIRYVADGTDDADEFGTMVNSALGDLKQQLWLSSRDMERRGVTLDSADGQVLEEYMNIGKTAMYQAISFQGEAARAETDADRYAAYSEAMTVLQKGICYVQLCQDEPSSIVKDLGEPMVDVRNLESAE